MTSGGVCKLGDFGCSVGLASNGKGPAGELTGTPGYQVGESKTSVHSLLLQRNDIFIQLILPGARIVERRGAKQSL